MGEKLYFEKIFQGKYGTNCFAFSVTRTENQVSGGEYDIKAIGFQDLFYKDSSIDKQVQRKINELVKNRNEREKEESLGY